MQESQKLTHSIKEVAKILGIGSTHAHNLVKTGRLKHVLVGKRKLIPRKEIEAFLEREISRG
jgi:excisionase family DNA binding protein